MSERAKSNVSCPICGKTFHAAPSRLKKYKVVCCSMECSKKWRAELMRGEGNHQYGLKGVDFLPVLKGGDSLNHAVSWFKGGSH